MTVFNWCAGVAMSLLLLPADAAKALEEAAWEQQLKAYFSAEPAKRAELRLDDDAYAKLTPADRDRVKSLALAAYRSGWESKDRRQNFVDRAVKSGKYTMPFTLERRGTKPKDGWPVLIAMHGGGGAPKRVNDSQWDHMKRRYGVTDCIYIAPRAPTDEWNGFYTDYVYPLFEELLRALVLYEEINPDRVYMIGYSHGGYGAFAMGPKMPDRFAAVHSSAAAVTDGEGAVENLMNLRFTYMIGERDTMYGRLERCRKTDARIAELKKEAAEGTYPVQMMFMPGRGHSDLRDLQVPQEMFKHQRATTPQRVRWLLTDPVIDRFYWLGVDKPAKGMSIEAEFKDNVVTIKPEKVTGLKVWLDDRLVDLSKPVTVLVEGKETFKGLATPKLSVWCETLANRGDPRLAFDVRVSTP
jgi:predicted esterase